MANDPAGSRQGRALERELDGWEPVCANQWRRPNEQRMQQKIMTANSVAQPIRMQRAMVQSRSRMDGDNLTGF